MSQSQTRCRSRSAGTAAVYLHAPGVVGRCASCDNVMIVIVEIRGIRCVDLRGIASVKKTRIAGAAPVRKERAGRDPGAAQARA